ncbi:hypothetical protein [Actinoplanes sichuanensis]|uniref:Uncharacterized protein n=1 Tax=Actinoplanes sichuanensis TaxID=512349 RepID=A0ABW4AE89_9ACTN|nr:hypothetical protein [Actinoplanes sichuanensis]
MTTPLAPGSTKYLMQTARMIEGGEPWCLQVHKAGETTPLQLKIAACDAAEKGQVFTFPKAAGGTRARPPCRASTTDSPVHRPRRDRRGRSSFQGW